MKNEKLLLRDARCAYPLSLLMRLLSKWLKPCLTHNAFISPMHVLYYFCIHTYVSNPFLIILYAEEDMPLEGLQLGRYRLLRLLGSGGMGEVYLAEDARIEQQVAVKVIRAEVTPYPDENATKEAARLFLREARAIAKLDHPNILSLSDFGEETIHNNALSYIVMPYRKEGSLTVWLRQHGTSGILSVEDISHMVNQAADALQHAHDHGVIHQDVKPSNFLIRERKGSRPDLLLADFGIAKFTTATATASQSVRGSPAYMAPEQWASQPVAATDQYALAVMTYQLLTGSPPFQGRQEQVMYLHFHAQPKPPSMLNAQIPKGVDAVIMRALAKKPEERFPSISAFAHAFQQAVTAFNSPSTPKAPDMPAQGGEDIRATLAISKAEAQAGTTRILNLPGGRPITVPIPPGIHDGQVIRFEGQGEASGSGRAGALILTVAIAPLEETVLPSTTDRTGEETFRSDPHRPQMTTPVPNVTAPPSQPGAKRFKQVAQRFRHLPRGKAALLIGLVLLVLLGGYGFFYFKYDNILQRNSLLNAGIANTYSSGIATLALNDPLSDNSNGYFWGESSTSAGGCGFSEGAYHASRPQKGYFFCTATATNFSNFVYQVQMTITQGDAGGIVFRFDETQGTHYLFLFGSDGSYRFDIYHNNHNVSTLKSGPSSTINADLNQPILVAVVANGSNIDLYVNNSHIDSVSDGTYSQGEIGVAAVSSGNPTEAVFSNAKVWTF
jgi:eukaryotic-like serine/threonine-protein kinase